MARIRKKHDVLAIPAVQWKVALYIRLSREDGYDESCSVVNQRKRLTAYLENLMLEENAELADYYVDDGYTGTDSDRDDFQRMLNDIDVSVVNCVIVKDLSRLSRNDWECKRYLQQLFVVKNVRFISLDLPKLDSYKNPDAVYDLAFVMQSMYNENHCRETSVKVRGTFDMKRKNGEFIGAFPPYGYLKDPADKHRFIVDHDAASIVKDIFHWFVRDGMSKNGIVRKLIGLGIPCPSAYKRQGGMNYLNPKTKNHQPLWSARSITTILENQMYLGHMVQGKQKRKSYKIHMRITMPERDWFIVKNMHEPLIDQETFDKAQELMLRDTRTAPAQGTLYPFSGFLRCADCGKAMVRRTSKNLVYYACQTYLNTKECTSRHTIRHEKLEYAVLTAIQKQIALLDDMIQLLNEINAAPAQRTNSNRLNAALKLRRQELEKITALRTGLYIDWKNDDLTREEYHSMKKEFEEKEQRLKQDIANLEEESQDFAQGVSSSDPYFAMFQKHRGIQSIDRGIIVELVKKIIIHESGDLTIEFNFTDKCRRVIEFIANNHKELTVVENIS